LSALKSTFYQHPAIPASW